MPSHARRPEGVQFAHRSVQPGPAGQLLHALPLPAAESPAALLPGQLATCTLTFMIYTVCAQRTTMIYRSTEDPGDIFAS
jgi:hypothetical protein